MKQQWLGLMLVTFASGAEDLRLYQADLEHSQWRLAENTKLSCVLEHDIPRYGTARFQTVASQQQNVSFVLTMLRQPGEYGSAQVLSVPPQWRPGMASHSMTSMPLLKQFDGELDDKSAWRLLAELEKGNVPTFYYHDWHNKEDGIAVGLSAINFSETYQKFLGCNAQLLPFSFEDIQVIALRYESNSDVLTKVSKQKLQQLALYLEQDKNIDNVTIEAYTDSYGGRWPNEQLSVKRANSLKTYLASLGLDETRIDIAGYGEKRHIASNQTELGRAKNRRVLITLEKS